MSCSYSKEEAQSGDVGETSFRGWNGEKTWEKKGRRQISQPKMQRKRSGNIVRAEGGCRCPGKSSINRQNSVVVKRDRRSGLYAKQRNRHTAPDTLAPRDDSRSSTHGWGSRRHKIAWPTQLRFDTLQRFKGAFTRLLDLSLWRPLLRPS